MDGILNGSIMPVMGHLQSVDEMVEERRQGLKW
jgi:hypothetical protein